MAPSIPAKLRKSRQSVKIFDTPPCRFFFFLYVFNFFYKKVIIRYSKPFQAAGSPQSSPEASHPAHFYRKTARDPQKKMVSRAVSVCFCSGCYPDYSALFTQMSSMNQRVEGTFDGLVNSI